MSLDFGKLTGGNTVDTVLSPREIFRALPGKDPKYQYLHDVQGEVLAEWFKKRNEKDLVLKMNTGTGKTLVGLLILKSCLNEGQGPALYVAPDTYLANQVTSEAKMLGINITDDPKDYAYQNSRAICVINIYKLVNGMSVFGVGEQGVKIPIGSVIVDDAHACLTTTEGQFTLSIEANDDTYKELFSLFRDALIQQSETKVMDIESKAYLMNMLVPYWVWIDRQSDVIKILHEVRNDDKVRFVWPLIKDHLSCCRCVFSGSDVEISPRCLPIDSIPSFIRASRRIFMTATLPNDSILITDFNVDASIVSRPITPQNANDIGDRMILIPQELNTSFTDDEIKTLLEKLSDKYNTVVIVPSMLRARYWEDVSKMVLIASNLQSGIEKLKNGHVGLVVLVNKYDGVDLPYNACRILVLDGLPDVRRRIDHIEQIMLEDSEVLLSRQIQRIEQGMGRGIRFTDDQCVVLLMGASLVNKLYAKNARSIFSSVTRAQLALSDKVAEQIRGKTLNDLLEVMEYSLNKDPEWLRVSRGVLLDLKYEKGGNVDAVSLWERKAFDAARIGQHDIAVKIMQEAVNKTTEPIMKGWLKQELAEYTHFLNPVDSQEILKSALILNPRLLKPLKGITYTKLSTRGLVQAQQCSKFLKSYSTNPNGLLIWLNAIIDNLQFREDNALLFEQAMKDLAFFLGFVGQRPEQEFGNGSDVLWEVGTGRYFLIACKNGADSDTICKRYCDEISGALNWFHAKYGTNCTRIPIMIHPSNIIDHQASPPADMRVIDRDRLDVFKNSVQNFGKAIASLTNYDDYKAIDGLLIKHNLTESPLINMHTTKFHLKKD